MGAGIQDREELASTLLKAGARLTKPASQCVHGHVTRVAPCIHPHADTILLQNAVTKPLQVIFLKENPMTTVTL